MSSKPILKDIQHNVESNYPHPIACMLRRYRHTKTDDIGSRHKLLVDIFELIIKYLAIVQLQEGIQRDSQFLNKLPQRDKTLEFLKRPSIGGWVGLLRTLAKVAYTSGNHPWSRLISDWYLERNDEESNVVLSALEEAGKVQVNRRNRSPRAEIIDCMVSYRNKSIAHGAQQNSGELDRRIVCLESIIAYLLRSACFLGDMRLVYSENIKVADNDKWDTEIATLQGCTKEPGSLLLDHKIELHELYVFGSETMSNAFPVRLAPFLIWQTNEDAKDQEVYFYNDAWRSKLEYLSYTSGTFYYHKELSEQLKALVRLDLMPAEHDNVIGEMPEDQRQEKAEQCFIHGRHLASQGQYENAICQYEQSLIYERRPSTFYEIAQLQILLNDPDEAIRHTLRNCLDIDPVHENAQALLTSLDDRNDKQLADIDRDTSNDVPKMGCAITSDIFTPSRFRAFSWLWWSVAVVMYYAISALIETLWGSATFVPSLLLLLLCILLLVGGPPLTRSLLCWIYYPLSLQLGGMRLERFEKWYRAQLRFIYGNYQFRNGSVDWVSTIRHELLYWIGWLLGTVILVIALVLSTDAADQSTPILIKRIIDYALPSFWAYPSARYVACVTAFIFNYSQLSLKPMLTKINDEGLRAMGHLTTLNASLVNAGYGTYLILSWLSIRSEWFLDVGIVMALFFIVITWSIGTPMMIRRACRRAKYMASLKYSGHIEAAFNEFLEHPSEDTQKEYQWLVDHQSVIQKIGVWPLSVFQTLSFVVGSNLFLTGLTVCYLLYRFDLWDRIGWL